jgi:site-specific DNA-methyltransferase (adenine-specific)
MGEGGERLESAWRLPGDFIWTHGKTSYFKDDAGGAHKKIIVQVKSGHVSAPQVQQLKGAMEREKADIAAFITLKPPTRPMRQEAAAAGFYVPEQFPEHRFPRLQILTIAELFAGKKLDYPQWALPSTFKKAASRRKGPSDQERQGELL